MKHLTNLYDPRKQDAKMMFYGSEVNMSEMATVSIPYEEALAQIRGIVISNLVLSEANRKNILFICDHAVEHLRVPGEGDTMYCKCAEPKYNELNMCLVCGYPRW